MAGVLVCIAGYAGFTTAAIGPSAGPVSPAAIRTITATLDFEDGKPVIVGSVSALFNSGEFVGPNQVEKRDRARPHVDAVELAGSFEAARQQMVAAIELPRKQAAERLETQLAAAGLLPPAARPAEVTQVAAIDPVAAAPQPAPLAMLDPTVTGSVNSSALDAINSGIGIDQTVPMPLEASTQLAYARDTAPVTEFGEYAGVQYSQQDMWCLAIAVYFEARGESYRGQVAVAQVVMNRLAHKLYPKTICGVVFQNQHMHNACQFSFACDGKPESVDDQTAWAVAQDVAAKVASGELYLSDVANATHYHATYVYPDWAPKMTKMATIGHHIFYRFKRNWSYG